VIAELRWLFTLHGPPLILKTDNGSAFIDAGLRRELRRWGVGQLFSPPRRPQYNGSIEASIGSLKKRTQHQCELPGHPASWTNKAVATAQLDANTTARPKRLKGFTPEQVWESRAELTPDDRVAFRATVEQYRREEQTRRGLLAAEALSMTEQAAVDRVAFRRALVAHELLVFRRRRIPSRITRPKLAEER
jgi:transposase InsO family protein